MEIERQGRAGNTSTQPGQPQLFEALDQQLGLKAEAKTLRIEMLVIDRLDRAPNEN
jgi:uncharacterized protein (TIGR03435 family)